MKDKRDYAIEFFVGNAAHQIAEDNTRGVWADSQNMQEYVLNIGRVNAALISDEMLDLFNKEYKSAVQGIEKDETNEMMFIP